jgi:dihydroxyacid dehydratase/phosphogluconate dehydratase
MSSVYHWPSDGFLLTLMFLSTMVQVGISSVWYEGNPCNMHLNQLAEEVKAGVVDCGLIGYRFNTVCHRHAAI